MVHLKADLRFRERLKLHKKLIVHFSEQLRVYLRVH